MNNSISTIFTMDLYAKFKPNAGEKHYVNVGRIVSLGALVIAMFCAEPLLGKFDQAFQYIQEFTGFFTPGICVIFLLGMFWKRTNANGALVAAIGSAVMTFVFWKWWPELPFMDRVGLVFLACVALAEVVSLVTKEVPNTSTAEDSKVDHSTTILFNIASIGVVIILCALLRHMVVTD